jgi:hypothetical protein
MLNTAADTAGRASQRLWIAAYRGFLNDGGAPVFQHS